MRSGNPTLRAFEQPQTWDQARGAVATADANTMTVAGTVTATGVLLGICVAAAIGSWAAATSPTYGHLAMPLFLGGIIGGLVSGLIVSFKPRTAQFLGPVYAACEGLFLGVFSFLVGGAVADATQQGTAVSVGSTLVLQAVSLTFAITAGMLFCYATGLIRPGRVFRAVVMSAVAGACLFGVAAMVLALFGNHTLISVYSPTNGGLVSLGVSVVLVVIASAVLVLDFQFIDHAVRSGAPKHMEWYAGFSLLVTLVWLYIELLRLLSKLRSK